MELPEDEGLCSERERRDTIGHTQGRDNIKLPSAVLSLKRRNVSKTFTGKDFIFYPEKRKASQLGGGVFLPLHLPQKQ